MLDLEGSDPKSSKSEDLRAKLNHLKLVYKFLFESVRERCEKIKSIMKVRFQLKNQYHVDYTIVRSPVLNNIERA